MRGAAKSPKNRPERPVLTITVTGEGMKRLDVAVEKFQARAETLPTWVKIPKTKAAIAGWLVDHFAEVALEEWNKEMARIFESH